MDAVPASQFGNRVAENRISGGTFLPALDIIWAPEIDENLEYEYDGLGNRVAVQSHPVVLSDIQN